MSVKKCKAGLKKCINILSVQVIDLLDEYIEDEVNKDKRLWSRDWLKRRHTHGASAMLLKELAVEDIKEYMGALRMTPNNFYDLLKLVGPQIERMTTMMRDPIPIQIKLEITLSFLATGNSYRSLQHLFRVAKPTISKFIPEVCDAISNKLKGVIKMPTTHDDWKVTIEGFERKWNFPNCCGAIDGKHIVIEAPPNSGSQYFNYKGSHSVVLLAVVDHNYCFTYVEVGHKGSESDGGVFQNSSLWLPLENGLLPDGCYFVGDDAFPLKPYLMKPYVAVHNRGLSQEEMIFNYRLSRARRIVENGFGILVSRFRVFDRKLSCKVTTVSKLVSAACSLHNWLRQNSPSTYLPPGSVDEENMNTGEIIPGRWREEISQLRALERFGGRRTTQLSKSIRDRVKSYVNTKGAVPWQHKFV